MTDTVKKVTITTILGMKQKKEKITALTSYEYLFTRIMDEMIYHTRIVSAAARRALVVGDMPFMSYQASQEEAVRNAGRFLKEGGAQAVKIEGGREWAELVRKLVMIGIPVLGHIGLTPQSIHQFGGFKVQGRSDADRIIEDAQILEENGAFAMVLEAIPKDLAQQVTGTVHIPTIGIGAGPHCDGQILVTQDMLGLFERYRPKFVRLYGNLAEQTGNAISAYIADVQSGSFPDETECYD